MAGLETGITLMENIFFKTAIFGQYWILELAIIILSMAIITRKIDDWKTLALPVMAGWQIFGLIFDPIFYVIGSIIFVIDVISMKMVSGALGAVKDSLGLATDYISNRGSYRGIGRTRRESRREDVKLSLNEERRKLWRTRNLTPLENNRKEMEENLKKMELGEISPLEMEEKAKDLAIKKWALRNLTPLEQREKWERNLAKANRINRRNNLEGDNEDPSIRVLRKGFLEEGKSGKEKGVKGWGMQSREAQGIGLLNQRFKKPYENDRKEGKVRDPSEYTRTTMSGRARDLFRRKDENKDILNLLRIRKKKLKRKEE